MQNRCLYAGFQLTPTLSEGIHENRFLYAAFYACFFKGKDFFRKFIYQSTPTQSEGIPVNFTGCLIFLRTLLSQKVPKVTNVNLRSEALIYSYSVEHKTCFLKIFENSFLNPGAAGKIHLRGLQSAHKSVQM